MKNKYVFKNIKTSEFEGNSKYKSGKLSVPRRIWIPAGMSWEGKKACMKLYFWICLYTELLDLNSICVDLQSANCVSSGEQVQRHCTNNNWDLIKRLKPSKGNKGFYYSSIALGQGFFWQPLITRRTGANASTNALVLISQREKNEAWKHSEE